MKRRCVRWFATREEPDVTARPTLTIQYVTCQGDLNGDGLVDDADFSIFVIAYGLMDCANGGMAERRQSGKLLNRNCERGNCSWRSAREEPVRAWGRKGWLSRPEGRPSNLSTSCAGRGLG